VRVRSRVGRRLPLHASGPGKVLLAHAPAEVRADGTCFSRDEMTDRASSMAAPVTGPSGEVVASASVVVPSCCGSGR
jgi:DNA-binding IclR family transcriptional regulator